MKKTILGIFFILSVSLSGQTGTGPGAGFSPAHFAKAKDFLDVSIDEKAYNQLIIDSLEQQISMNPSISEYRTVMQDFFFKYMSLEAMRDDLAAIYARAFTIQELNDLIVFYRTPTGRKAAGLMSTLFNEGSLIGRQRVQEHMPELQAAIVEASNR